MKRPLALDLFCKAGGATKGLQRAGFTVVGVDIERQPRYCGDYFVQADALNPPFDLSQFDFIWASPPCQAHTKLRHMQNKSYHDLINQTRDMLWQSKKLTVIENVPGAPLISPFHLCGSMFGLGVWRHRCFESTLPMLVYQCNHPICPNPVDVTGTGGPFNGIRKSPGGGVSRKPNNLSHARSVMGIDWMNRGELSQAIPPAYSEYIGRAALKYLGAAP